MEKRTDRRALAFVVLLAAFTLLLVASAAYLTASQSAAALNVTPQRFDETLASSGRVAVFYSATGCTACDEARPLWQALSTQFGGSTTFLEVRYSVVTSPLFERYGIQNTPTFLMYVGGSEVAEHLGTFASSQQMTEFLQSGAPSQPSSPSSSSPVTPLTSLWSDAPSLLVSAVLGVGVFASPCVLPLLPGYVAFLVGREKATKRSIELSSAMSFVAGAVGILLVGGVFILVGNLFWSVLLGGKLVISFALMALGLAALLGIGLFPSGGRILGVSSVSDHVRGITTYSLLYGVLSLGCSLPFVIGGMLNILAGVGAYSMVLRLLVFAFGFSAPLAALTYATQKGVNLSASRLGRGSYILQRVGGAAMIGASLLLLFAL